MADPQRGGCHHRRATCLASRAVMDTPRPWPPSLLPFSLHTDDVSGRPPGWLLSGCGTGSAADHGDDPQRVQPHARGAGNYPVMPGAVSDLYLCALSLELSPDPTTR